MTTEDQKLTNGSVKPADDPRKCIPYIIMQRSMCWLSSCRAQFICKLLMTLRTDCMRRSSDTHALCFESFPSLWWPWRDIAFVNILRKYSRKNSRHRECMRKYSRKNLHCKYLRKYSRMRCFFRSPYFSLRQYFVNSHPHAYNPYLSYLTGIFGGMVNMGFHVDNLW